MRNATCAHTIVEIEVVTRRSWHEVISRDGVKSEATVLRPRAPREVAR